MPNLKHLTHGISNLVSLITKTKLGLSVAQWEEVGRLFLPGVRLQMLRLQEAAIPREVSKTL
jgi:predicted component of type VI protein secretion system